MFKTCITINTGLFLLVIQAMLSIFGNKHILYLGQGTIFSILISLILFLQSYELKKLQNNQIQEKAVYLSQKEKESNHILLLEKMPSFGFSNLLGKWSFLKFLQYFGDDDARKFTGYSLSPQYFQIIVEQDPWFTDSYFYLYASVSLFSGNPKKTIFLLDKGLKTMSPQKPPNGFFLWKFKSLDELLFFGDIANAYESLETASKWASMSSHPQKEFYSKSYKESANFLKTQPNIDWIKIQSWLSVMPYALDEKTQVRVFSEIESLGGKVIQNSDGSFSVHLPE